MTSVLSADAKNESLNFQISENLMLEIENTVMVVDLIFSTIFISVNFISDKLHASEDTGFLITSIHSRFKENHFGDSIHSNLQE